MSEKPKIILNRGREARIRRGHQWIFSNEIQGIGGLPRSGDVVEICSFDERLLGVGFYNPNSLIACRLLAFEPVEVDHDFFHERFKKARDLRERIYPEMPSYRLVHGESDRLPGLIIDRYGDFLVLQTLSAGMDTRIEMIADVLEAIFKPAAIVERNESHVRELEGLTTGKGILRGAIDGPVEVEEWGIRYQLDLLSGHKTGFYLDQRLVRRAMRSYVKDGKVLDCFTNDGAFALNAAIAGASEVLGIDSSGDSVRRARKNARINKLHANCRFEDDYAVRALSKLREKGETFDLIVLDPPAFAKIKKHVPTAKQGYEKINYMAIKLVKAGGFLVTASCSGHIFESTFEEILLNAANKAGVDIRILERFGQAPDHPILPAMPETRYLKGFICQVF